MSRSTGSWSGQSATSLGDNMYQYLRRITLFDGIPNEFFHRALQDGWIKRHELRRDMLVADTVTRDGSGVALLESGHIAVGVFDAQELRERRSRQDPEAVTRQSGEHAQVLEVPLARLAKKNIAMFADGDLFNLGVVQSALQESDRLPVAFYTTAPSVLITVTSEAMTDLARKHPFFQERVARAIRFNAARLSGISGTKQEIFDFFVRHGISVSGPMVRVRQLDKCIDCKLCEEACETRYGAKRLTLGGYQLGMLDFVYTCRTCTDQRCIDPCEYDSITYDNVRGEVIINEASCTGCTLCAQACPYHAIEMVDVEDRSNPTFRSGFKKRLERKGNLSFGAGTPRAARARRIANKCDHCISYRDQACISACPTGSLIEISAYELFHERSRDSVAVARSGFDREVPNATTEPLSAKPFTDGVGVKNAGLARVRRGRAVPLAMWGIALAGWFLAMLEIFLRFYAPTKSLQYTRLLAEGYNPEAAEESVGYWAGCDLAVWCGYVGASLLAIAALYPMVRRIRLFRFLASNTMWFDIHTMAGVVGPMYIGLHSALKLDNWVSIAFWSMVVVVISGFIGRYLYTQLPDLLNGRELEELDHKRAFARIRRDHPKAVAACEARLRSHHEWATKVGKSAGLFGAFVWLILEDWKRPIRWWMRHAELRKIGGPASVRRELVHRTGRLTIIDRRGVIGSHAQLILHSWKKVHVPFTMILLIVSSVHIWIAFQYSM